MTKSFLITIFIGIFLFHLYPSDVHCQIAEIASLVTSILGGAGNGAAIGNVATAGAGAAKAIGNLGALYQLAQSAMQLTGTGVGIANQASESQWFPIVVEQAAKNHRMMTERLAAFNSGRAVNPLTFGGTDGFGGAVTSYYRTTTESTLPSEYGSKIVITETTEYPKTSKSKPDLTKVDKEDNVDEYEEEKNEKSGSVGKKDEDYSEEINNRIDVDNGENIDGLSEKSVKSENKSIEKIKEKSKEKNKSLKSGGEDEDEKESEEDEDERVETIKKLMNILKKSDLKKSEFEEIAKQLTKNGKEEEKLTTKAPITTTTPTTTTTTEEDYSSEETSESMERRRIIEETKRQLGHRTTILRRITTLNPRHSTLIKLISTTPLPDSEKIFPIPLSQAIKSDNNRPGSLIENDKLPKTTTIQTPNPEKPHIILVKPESSMFKDPQGGIPIESVKKASKRIFTATIPINHNSDNIIPPNEIVGRPQQKISNFQTSTRIHEKNQPSINNAQQGNFVRFNGATTFNSNANMPLQTIQGTNVPYQQNYNNRQQLPYQNNNNVINRPNELYNNKINNYQQRTTLPSQVYHQINVPYNNGFQQPYRALFNQQQQQWRGYNNNNNHYQQSQYHQLYYQNNAIPNNNNVNYYTNNQQTQNGVWRNGR
uniref:Uncharacterized protein n=1 Tax=Strongyloides venezuelensis TaxID=75913 RepID=A0A0K0FTY8_STRVS